MLSASKSLRCMMLYPLPFPPAKTLSSFCASLGAASALHSQSSPRARRESISSSGMVSPLSLASFRSSPVGSSWFRSSDMSIFFRDAGTLRTIKLKGCPGDQSPSWTASSNVSYISPSMSSPVILSTNWMPSTSPQPLRSDGTLSPPSPASSAISNPFCFSAALVASLAVRSMLYIR